MNGAEHEAVHDLVAIVALGAASPDETARVGGDAIYWRQRGDSAYKPLTSPDYDTLRKTFVATERVDLLDR